MNKVYIVFQEKSWNSDQVLSVHVTEESAKKECEKLLERRKVKYNCPYDTYFWEEYNVEL